MLVVTFSSDSIFVLFARVRICRICIWPPVHVYSLKKIEFTLESNNNSTAKNTVKDLCEKFLVNEIIEKYKIKIENAKN